MIKMLFAMVAMLSLTTQTESVNDISVERASFHNQYQYDFGQWVTDRLVYPQQAMLNEIEGCVDVMFTIDKVGRVVNVRVDRGASEVLNKEVMRVISLSPRWKPMKINGESVESHYTMRINFSLR